MLFRSTYRRIKSKNKILFTRESGCISDLSALICKQSHLTIVLWVFDCLKELSALILEKHPHEKDIQSAMDLCCLWAHGDIKMPMAKRAILDCHKVAKRLESPFDIAICHSIGQGLSSIHVETHALGMVFYHLTSLVIECEYKDFEDEVLKKLDYYKERLIFWEENTDYYLRSEERRVGKEC